MNERAYKKIERAIKTNSDVLNLIGCNLTWLDLPVESLPNLKRLFLHSNKLIELPENIGNLTQLQYLVADYNHLTSIPESIGNLENLTQLNLSFNRLEKLPKSIGKLHKLVYLFLNDNKLESIPNFIAEHSDVINFDISNNRLKVIPDFIDKFTSIEKLTLSNNSIEIIPDSFFFDNIKSLFIDGNNISCIPANFIFMSTLEELDLSRNRLKSFPVNIDALDSLKILRLSNNHLERLDEEIGYIDNLRILDLSSNELKELPASIGSLSTLTSLNLSENKLEEFTFNFFSLYNLEFLNLNNNKLSALPEGILELHKLISLGLRNNQFEEYPGELSDLMSPNLMIDFRGNPLDQLISSRSERFTKIWKGTPRHLRDLLKIYFSGFSVFYRDRTQKEIVFNVLNNADELAFDLVPGDDTDPAQIDALLDEYFEILKQKLAQGADTGIIYPTPTDDPANLFAQGQAMNFATSMLRVKNEIQGYVEDQDAYLSVSKTLESMDAQFKDALIVNHKLMLAYQKQTIARTRLEERSTNLKDEVDSRRIEAQTRASLPLAISISQQVTINNQIGDAFDELITKIHPHLDVKQRDDAKDLQKEIDLITEKPTATPEEKKGLGKRLKRFVDGMNETLKTTKGFGEAAKEAGEQFDKLKEFAGSVLHNPSVIEAIENLKHLIDNSHSV